MWQAHVPESFLLYAPRSRLALSAISQGSKADPTVLLMQSQILFQGRGAVIRRRVHLHVFRSVGTLVLV